MNAFKISNEKIHHKKLYKSMIKRKLIQVESDYKVGGSLYVAINEFLSNHYNYTEQYVYNFAKKVFDKIQSVYDDEDLTPPLGWSNLLKELYLAVESNNRNSSYYANIFNQFQTQYKTELILLDF
jgi:hypothetical protein